MIQWDTESSYNYILSKGSIRSHISIMSNSSHIWHSLLCWFFFCASRKVIMFLFINLMAAVAKPFARVVLRSAKKSTGLGHCHDWKCCSMTDWGSMGSKLTQLQNAFLTPTSSQVRSGCIEENKLWPTADHSPSWWKFNKCLMVMCKSAWVQILSMAFSLKLYTLSWNWSFIQGGIRMYANGFLASNSPASLFAWISEG